MSHLGEGHCVCRAWFIHSHTCVACMGGKAICCLHAVALLTEKILSLAEHMRTHRKDFSSRRGLEAMLANRRTLLQYLRVADFEAYSVLIARLGLKDSYTRQDRVTMRWDSSGASAASRKQAAAKKKHKNRRGK